MINTSLSVKDIMPDGIVSMTKDDGWHTNDNSASMHFFIGQKSACGLKKDDSFVADNDPSKYCQKCMTNRNALLRGEPIN